MRRILLLAALAALSACSRPILPAPRVPEPVMEPEVLAIPEPVYTADATVCPTGDGDGIGGTGCRID
jgi:hypothetical protein